jgi:hypothetical protein
MPDESVTSTNAAGVETGRRRTHFAPAGSRRPEFGRTPRRRVRKHRDPVAELATGP